MTGDRRSILIDARVNALPGAHGIARSVLQLAAHLPPPPGGRALRVLVNAHREQIFPLSALPPHAEVINTDITLPAVHRCRELARLIRAAGADVLWVPYPTFTPVIRPCPVVVTIHDCTIENDVGFAGGWHRQAACGWSPGPCSGGPRRPPRRPGPPSPISCSTIRTPPVPRWYRTAWTPGRSPG